MKQHFGLMANLGHVNISLISNIDHEVTLWDNSHKTHKKRKKLEGDK